MVVAGGNAAAGRNGGSGGGGWQTGNTAGGSSTQTTTNDGYTSTGWGNAGGQGGSGAPYQGGGGGGAGAVGVAGKGSGGISSIPTGGNGGIGKAYTIADGSTSVYYSGGGGGGVVESGSSSTDTGQGGSGGGGRGGYNSSGSYVEPVAGTANTGGGGGGGRNDDAGAAGGSGVVIVYDGTTRTTFTSSNEPHTITANGDATNQRPQHHNVTANGDAHLIGPKVGTSVISMDGTGDSIYAASSSDFNFGTGDFTLEAWMNNNGSGNEAIFAHFTSGTDKWYFIADYGNGSIAIYDRVSGLDAESKRGGSNGASLTNGAWHHVAAVRSSGVVKFYIDGKGQDNQVTPTLPAANFGKTATCYIGEDGQGSDYWKGYFGPLRISNSARYTADFDVPTTVWTNDGNTKLLIQNGTDGSQTFTDSSSSSHSITVNGDARWFAPKVGAGAMAFDGTGDYFSVPDSVDWDFGAGDFTIEFWAKIGASAPDGSMLSHYDVSSQRSWSVVLDATNNELEFVYSTDGSSATTAAFSWSYSEHTWYLVSICRSGADLKAFIDGTQIGSTHDISTSDLHNSTSTLTIGGDVRSGMGYLFKGAIDDLRIVRTALRTSNWTASTSAFTDSINTVLLLNADINQGTWAEDSSTGLAISTDSRMKFDGTGDYLSVPDSSDWDFSGDFTVECWFNTSAASTEQAIYGTEVTHTNNNRWAFWIDTDNKLGFFIRGVATSAQGTTVLNVSTWYHLAAVRNGSTIKLYIDGVEEASFSDSTSLVADGLVVGCWYTGGTSSYMNGYLDELRISDNARYTSAFTPQTRGNPFTADANTKLLIHSDYTGGLGADSSGNYNNFTATNLVATDQMVDSPTVNIATLNPLLSNQNSANYYEGNLRWKTNTSGGQDVSTASTITASSGKWYCEFYAKDSSRNSDWIMGIGDNINELNIGSSYLGQTGNSFGYYPAGQQVYGPLGTTNSYGPSGKGDGDIFMMAVDIDAGKAWWGVNGTWNNSGDPAAGTNSVAITAGLMYAFGVGHATDGGNWVDYVANFGADSSFAGNKTAQGNSDSGGATTDFFYEPPSGFLALCSENLPDPEIKLPGEFHSTVLYTGDGNTTHAITGVGFSPAMNWVKARGFTKDHNLVDSVRGAHFRLIPNGTNAESEDDEKIVSLDSDGFTTGVDSATNDFTEPYVAWNWKAGTTNSGATSGSGTAKTYSSSTSATAGFSIIKYVGNGTSGHQIPHHMGVAPQCLIAKNLDRGSGAGSDWHVWHTGFGTQDKYIWLNQSNPAYASSNYFNAVSSTTFSLGTDTSVNADGEDIICYAFTGIENYSQFGSYEGNNNADGTFIYTGFEPAFLIYKNIDATADWGMVDNKRSPYNTLTKYLAANENAAEITNSFGDFTSNGIKMRNTYGGANAANTYIYLAFAESPFKYSNAR